MLKVTANVCLNMRTNITHIILLYVVTDLFFNLGLDKNECNLSNPMTFLKLEGKM